MFELIEPMSVILSDNESAIDSEELDDLSKLFGDEVSTNSQQALDSLFSGSED
jgi:hypothetical protein